MNYDTILLQTDLRGVATLTLNRPDTHNVLSAHMADELRAAAAAINADPAIRAVVLTGAGHSFCAGGDLGWMRQQFEADRAGRIAEARRLAQMFFDLNTLTKPLIGRINGTAMGGGLGLMAVCDVAIAAMGGKFGFTETRLGLIPATISPYVVARMGEGRARSVFMSSRVFGADTLVPLGLAAAVASPDTLDAAVEAEVLPYLTAAPEAVSAAKALARDLGPVIDEAVITDTVNRLADTWESAAAQEGIAAFFAKRPPGWVQGE